MKTKLKILLTLAALGSISLLGCRPATDANQPWRPKIGDRVQTHYGGSNFVTTLTNVVNVGSRSQTGLIVYGRGLPGVDSWWVTPAP